VEGVTYSHTGTVEVPDDGLSITAEPAKGYAFAEGTVTEWTYMHEDEDYDPALSASGSQVTLSNAQPGEDYQFSVGPFWDRQTHTLTASDDGEVRINTTQIFT